jgi:hypothetical protein
MCLKHDYLSVGVFASFTPRGTQYDDTRQPRGAVSLLTSPAVMGEWGVREQVMILKEICLLTE